MAASLAELRGEMPVSELAYRITEFKRAIDPNQKPLGTNAIYSWESGSSAPNGLNLLAYASVLNVDPKVILELANTRKKTRSQAVSK